MLGHVLAFIGHKGIERYHMSHKSLLFWEFIVNVTLSGQRNNEYYSIWSGVNLKGGLLVCVKGALLCKSLICVR